MAVVSNNSGPSDYSENFFTSLSRFSDIIPLHIGIGKTAFTAVDRSLRDRQVVIKTHVCTGDLSQQLLSHIESLRKLSHRNIIDIYDAFLINENSDGCERQPLERLCIVQVSTGLLIGFDCFFFCAIFRGEANAGILAYSMLNTMLFVFNFQQLCAWH
jgi:hypothetical protein